MICRTIKKVAALTVLAVSLSACSSMSVQHDWDTSIDLAGLQVFTVLGNDNNSLASEYDQLIHAAIVDGLTAKGMTQTGSLDAADLAVVYTVVTQQRSTDQSVHVGFSTSHDLRSGRTRLGASTGLSRNTEPLTFTVGTLVVAIYLSSSKELVWEGTASDTVNTNATVAENAPQINEAVSRILAKFPPAP